MTKSVLDYIDTCLQGFKNSSSSLCRDNTILKSLHINGGRYIEDEILIKLLGLLKSFHGINICREREFKVQICRCFPDNTFIPYRDNTCSSNTGEFRKRLQHDFR